MLSLCATIFFDFSPHSMYETEACLGPALCAQAVSQGAEHYTRGDHCEQGLIECHMQSHNTMRMPMDSEFLQGLGEMMPEQLWHTTLDPQRRMLRRLTLSDAAEAAQLFSLLMGSQVSLMMSLLVEQGRG